MYCKCVFCFYSANLADSASKPLYCPSPVTCAGWRETSQKAKTDPRHPPHREASRRVLKKNDVPNKVWL